VGGKSGTLPAMGRLLKKSGSQRQPLKGRLKGKTT
jgi:hypothetical protein